jgi:hypothetical protein
MTTADHYPPFFATNRPGADETVAAELVWLFKGARELYADPAAVAIATAYLNPAGFVLLADELEQAPSVRLLLGAEPDPAVGQRTVPPVTDEETRAALRNHGEWLERERDLTGFSREEDAAAHRMVEWLQSIGDSGSRIVEVRRYAKGFLHGKAYIAEHPQVPAVLAGSSNLTYAGLMLNVELNLGYPTGEHTHLVQEWFEHFWAESETFDLAGLYARRWEPHSPWLVFLRMLWELYGDTSADDQIVSTMHLTGFQREGVARMLRVLDEHGGVIVADEVGLGKTFMAAEVMRRATEQARQRVLIVAPAALKASMWEPFLERYDMSRRIKVVSYAELRIHWQENPDFRADVDERALVVIDEAHNLRNPSAQQTEAVAELLSGPNPKKVLLLTATPVNNSLFDLHTLVRFFINNDAEFARLGIQSIRQYIADAQKLAPDSLSPEALFDLIDQVMVRRTRRFIKTQYQGDKIPGPDGTEITIVFPEPVLHRLDYELDEPGTELLEEVIYALTDSEDELRYEKRRSDNRRLMLSRYTPGAYSIDGKYEEAFQFVNAGLLRSGLLKRLESSPAALANTLGRLITSHGAFLTALAAGHVVIGEALSEWTSSDAEDFDDFIEGLDDSKIWNIESVDGYHVEALTSDVTEDLELLKRLKVKTDAANETTDSKALRLIDRLREIATESRTVSKAGLSAGDRRKTVVFSTFADTIQNVHTSVAEAIDGAADDDPLADFKGRIPPAVFGSKTGIEQEQRARVLAGFAPETAGRPGSEDRYDLLFSTDVLSEGVNLQQAGRIVNYDLPWNPMRIVQRHGRIDRIGSKHPRVFLDCFFPAAHLDSLLGLEGRLHAKLSRADAAVGVGEVLPGFDGSAGRVFADTEEQIRQIADEDVTLLLNEGAGNALSGEEYRRRLRRATEPSTLGDDVRRLPYGSGSGFVNEHARTHGFSFCARIGDNDKPVFRFIPTDDSWNPTDGPDGQPIVTRQTLTALSAADPGAEATERHLPEEAYEAAFDAWAVAKKDIESEWARLADPKALQARIPKALRDAVAFVGDHGEFLGNQEQNDLFERLNSVPSHRVERLVREILNGDHSDRETVELLAGLAERENLQAAPPPPQIDPVHPAEIKLVVWMAIAPPTR